MNNVRVKVVLAVVTVFVMGAVSGGALGYGLAHREWAQMMRDEFRGPREGGPLRMLSRTLDLSEEQRHKIADIFHRHGRQRRELMREAFKRCGDPLETHRRRVDAEIRAVLDPSQQKRFDAIVEQRRQRRDGGPFGDAPTPGFGPAFGPPHEPPPE